MIKATVGIDIGNTNMKCIILDNAGNVLALSKIPTNIYGTTPEGQAYLNGDVIMGSIASLCKDAMAQAPEACIQGIAVSGMGSAGMMLDEAGELIPPVKLPQQPDPMPSMSEAEYFHTNGYHKYYHNGGVYLAQLSQLRPDIFAKIHTVLSFSDYVSYRLSGVMARDLSTAGSLSVVNINTGQNWQAFLDEYNIPNSMLPPLVQSGDYIGEMQMDIGLPMDTKVFAGGHDYLCAAFAAGCVQEGDVINVLGTYEMMSCFYTKPPSPPSYPPILHFMDNHVYPGRYTFTTENNCGDSIRKAVSQGEEAELTGADMFKALNEGNPITDGPIRALAQAIMDINKMSATMVKVHQQTLGRDALRIKVVGGGSSNHFWMQNKANTLGIPLYVPAVPEASAAGAALLAGVGSGLFPSYDAAAQVFETREEKQYQPQ